MSTLRLLLCSTGHFVVIAPLSGNDCDVDDYLKKLKKCNQKESKKAAAILLHLANHGMSNFTAERIKALRDGIYELRSNSGLRMLVFATNSTFIVIHSVFLKGEVTFKKQTQLIDDAVEYKKSLGRFTVHDDNDK